MVLGCLLIQAAGLRTEAVAQAASSSTASDAETPKFVALEHRSAAEMAAQDKSLVHVKQREIATEAYFFGYDLASGHWSYDQVVCPATPDSLILHYHSRARDGAESLFTALVPRGSERVFVVPVLFRNATPFHSAVGSERSLAVFNRAVPDEIATPAAQANGQWLQLAMCYAAMVGAEPEVPEHTEEQAGLVRAPVPTLRVSDDTHSREVVFSDRNNPGQYMVWNISMSDKGRVTAAMARTFSDYQAHATNPQAPPMRVVPPGTEPTPRPVPPSETPRTTVSQPEPPETTTPQ